MKQKKKQPLDLLDKRCCNRQHALEIRLLFQLFLSQLLNKTRSAWVAWALLFCIPDRVAAHKVTEH